MMRTVPGLATLARRPGWLEPRGGVVIAKPTPRGFARVMRCKNQGKKATKVYQSIPFGNHLPIHLPIHSDASAGFVCQPKLGTMLAELGTPGVLWAS